MNLSFENYLKIKIKLGIFFYFDFIFSLIEYHFTYKFNK